MCEDYNTSMVGSILLWQGDTHLHAGIAEFDKKVLHIVCVRATHQLHQSALFAICPIPAHFSCATSTHVCFLRCRNRHTWRIQVSACAAPAQHQTIVLTAASMIMKDIKCQTTQQDFNGHLVTEGMGRLSCSCQSHCRV